MIECSTILTLRSQAAIDRMEIAASVLLTSLTRTTRAVVAFYTTTRTAAAMICWMAVALFSREPKQDVYNILWAVVFGFATINILSLATRRMEPGRRRMTFGELMAVMVVLISIFLLAWELLNVFHIFPIKLRR